MAFAVGPRGGFHPVAQNCPHLGEDWGVGAFLGEVDHFETVGAHIVELLAVESFVVEDVFPVFRNGTPISAVC